MQASQRKISKKELKEDQLITFFYNSKAFLEKNGKIVSYVAVGVIAIAIIVTLMIKSRAQSNIIAGSELFLAQLQFNMNDYQNAVVKLNTLIETYPGTKNASEAMILLAKTYFKTANFDSSYYFANEFLKRHSGDPILTCAAYSLKAASLEEKGEFQNAAETYLEGANRFPKNFTAPTFLIDAGRCFYLADEMDRARSCYERLIDEFPDSNLIQRANQQLVRAGGTERDVNHVMNLLP